MTHTGSSHHALTPATRTSSAGLGRAAGGFAQRPAERADDAYRQQPPRVDPGHVDEQRGQGQGHDDNRRTAPVITDDEVVPERAERAEPATHRAPSSEAT